MFDVIKQWYLKKFSDPNAVTLVLLLLVICLSLYFFSSLMMPVLVALTIAYLLEGPTQSLQRLGLGRALASSVVMSVFVGVMTALLVGALPVIWTQGLHFFEEAPNMIAKGKALLMTLPERYPALVGAEQIGHLIESLDGKLYAFWGSLLQASVTSLKSIISWLIYLILVPILIFFMLKDKQPLVDGVVRLLPKERRMISKVWLEMNVQIMNYIRGKVLELVVVAVVSYVTFLFFDLRYAALLGFLIGISVLIPYVGAALVTIPVAAVALFQFGLTAEFGYVMLAYGIIQALDGNVLVPILFSEAVDLNPVYIIVAVLFFGGLLGFWGIFFAIPLASLVRAVVNAWSEQVDQKHAQASN